MSLLFFERDNCYSSVPLFSSITRVDCDYNFRTDPFDLDNIDSWRDDLYPISTEGNWFEKPASFFFFRPSFALSGRWRKGFLFSEEWSFFLSTRGTAALSEEYQSTCLSLCFLPSGPIRFVHWSESLSFLLSFPFLRGENDRESFPFSLLFRWSQRRTQRLKKNYFWIYTEIRFLESNTTFRDNLLFIYKNP